jgi:histidine ammonia-lyase
MILDGNNLKIQDVIDITRSETKVTLSDKVRDKLTKTRELIAAEWMCDDASLIYAFNTGVGAFKNTRIALTDMQAFQTKIIYAHATGVGEALPVDAARAVMLLRLNAFCSDHSGVSLAVVDRLLEFLNKGLTPVIPAKGSVGASGDLAPLAHMAGALCGFKEAEIIYEGTRMPALAALKLAGLGADLDLQSKDASALINGSTVSLAVAVLALADAENIAEHADIGLALSLEAMRCEKDAFHPALHAARPHPGQALVARNIMALIGDSKRMTPEAREIPLPDEMVPSDGVILQRIQDSYALRCAPQVHGPVREALIYIRGIVEREIGSATDNPLIIKDGGQRRAISGGHFHGQYIAQVMDMLAMVMTDLGAIAERRIARLIDPVMSYGLPRNLASGTPGLNTGYATVQCSMSALVMENRTLSMSGSVDTIPGKGNAEDHVSNSMWCANKAAQVVNNTCAVVAAEILMAAQAVSMTEDILKNHPPAKATREIIKNIRKQIPARLDGDIWYADDMAKITAMVRGKEILVKRS